MRVGWKKRLRQETASEIHVKREEMRNKRQNNDTEEEKDRRMDGWKMIKGRGREKTCKTYGR